MLFTLGVAQFRNTTAPSFQRSKLNTKINQKSANKEESRGNGREKNFPLLPRVTGGTESVLPVPAWPSGQSERKVRIEKQSTGGIGLPQAGPCFCIPNLSRKRKRVNPGNSDAEYVVLLHHEFGKGNSKRRNTGSVRRVRGNRNSRSKRESGCTYVCGVSGIKNTRRRTGKRELLNT